MALQKCYIVIINVISPTTLAEELMSLECKSSAGVTIFPLTPFEQLDLVVAQ